MQRRLRQRSDAPNLLIDPDQEWQCRWWSKELGVTPRQLREAIQQVGRKSKAVRAYLDFRSLDYQLKHTTLAEHRMAVSRGERGLGRASHSHSLS